MKRFSINGFHFRYNRQGLHPDGKINFAAPGAVEAITEAVERWHKGFVKDPRSYVYIGWSDYRNAFKIGKSNNPTVRAAEQGLKVVHTIECPTEKEAYTLETFLQTFFWNRAIGGWQEYFHLYEHQIDWLMGFANSSEVPRQLPEGAVSPRSRRHPRRLRGWQPHD